MLLELASEIFAAAIGWVVCISVLSLGYLAGFFAADFLGFIDPSDLGILSAIAVVWLYEHRRAHSRWGSMNVQLDRLWAKAQKLD
jgi:hypothetical protein